MTVVRRDHGELIQSKLASGMGDARQLQPGRLYNFFNPATFAEAGANVCRGTVSEVSAACWLIPALQVDRRYILCEWRSAAGGRRWALWEEPNGAITILLSADGTSSGVYTTNAGLLNDGVAAHVGFTYNAGSIKVYVNGAEEATFSASELTLFDNDAACNFTIADLNSGNTTTRCRGKIGQVYVCQEELSAAQMLSLAGGVLPTVATPNRSFCALEEGTASPVYDAYNHLAVFFIDSHSEIERETTRLFPSAANDRGFTLGTGSNGAAAGVIIPRNEANPSQDVLGNAIEFTDRAPLEPLIEESPSVSFDGNVQFANAENQTFWRPANNSTMEIEFYYRSSGSGYQGICGNYASGSQGWGVFISSSQLIEWWAGTGSVQISGPVVPNDGTWHHIKIVKTASTDAASCCSGFLDGVPFAMSGSGSIPTLVYTNVSPAIGQVGTSKLTGSLAGLKVTVDGVLTVVPCNEGAGNTLQCDGAHEFILRQPSGSTWTTRQSQYSAAQRLGFSDRLENWAPDCRIDSRRLDTGITAPSSGALECEFILHAPPPNNSRTVLLGSHGSGSNLGIQVFNSAGTINVFSYYGTVFTPAYEIQTGTLYKMRITWAPGGNLTLFVNDAQERQVSASGSPTSRNIYINSNEAGATVTHNYATVFNVVVEDGGGTIHQWNLDDGTRGYRRARKYDGVGGNQSFGLSVPANGNIIFYQWVKLDSSPTSNSALFANGLDASAASRFTLWAGSSGNGLEVYCGNQSGRRGTLLIPDQDWYLIEVTWAIGDATIAFNAYDVLGNNAVAGAALLDATGFTGGAPSIGLAVVNELGSANNSAIGPTIYCLPALAADVATYKAAVREFMLAPNPNGPTAQQKSDWSMFGYWQNAQESGVSIECAGVADLPEVLSPAASNVEGPHWNQLRDSVAKTHLQKPSAMERVRVAGVAALDGTDSSGAAITHLAGDYFKPSSERLDFTQNTPDLPWTYNLPVNPSYEFGAQSEFAPSVNDDRFMSSGADGQQRRGLIYRDSIANADDAEQYVEE